MGSKGKLNSKTGVLSLCFDDTCTSCMDLIIDNKCKTNVLMGPTMNQLSFVNILSCDGVLVLPSSSHCGACGIKCQSDESCVANVCVKTDSIPSVIFIALIS